MEMRIEEREEEYVNRALKTKCWLVKACLDLDSTRK
jgi:hypothetical protein